MRESFVALAGWRPVPEQEASALPSNAAPTVRKPAMALVMCGVVLLVPLTLSAPRARSSAGKDVVLAAGPPAAGPAEEVASASDEVAPEVDTVPADEPTTADERGASAPPPTVRRAASKASSPSAGIVTSKPKAKAPAPATAAAAEAPAAVAVAAPAAVTAARATAAVPAPAAPAAAPTVRPPPAAPVAAPAPAPASAADAVWDRLAQCESSNTNDSGAPYYGYWQFSAATWHSVGEPGLPSDHPRARQLAAAKRLQAAQGWTPWPDCSRRLGLR